MTRRRPHRFHYVFRHKVWLKVTQEDATHTTLCLVPPAVRPPTADGPSCSGATQRCLEVRSFVPMTSPMKCVPCNSIISTRSKTVLKCEMCEFCIRWNSTFVQK